MYFSSCVVSGLTPRTRTAKVQKPREAGSPAFFCVPMTVEHDRYYIDGKPEAEVIDLSREESHHLIHVRRAKPGARVTLFDGEGREYRAEVVEFHKGVATVRVAEGKAVNRELPFLLTLAVAPLKPKVMQDVIHQAAELGIHCLQPVYCTNSVVHYRDFEKKREKWRRIMIEACKGCGRNILPLIAAPQALAHFLEESRDSLLLFAHRSEDAKHIKDLVPFPPGRRGVICFVGPEGGFTDEEAHLAASKGAHIVSLGPTRLRAETAAVALLSAAILKGGCAHPRKEIDNSRR